MGQPEFRGILQRPEMGAVPPARGDHLPYWPPGRGRDQRYMEHRLKCAGSTGKPTFDHDAFPAIYKASQASRAASTGL